jgi:predicted RNase H-like HicB family nuclease
MKNLNCIIIPDRGSFVAQGLELDIAAQGKTVEDALSALEETLILQIAAYIEIDQDPIDQIGNAPQEYWDLLSICETAEKDGVFYLPSVKELL